MAQGVGGVDDVRRAVGVADPARGRLLEEVLDHPHPLGGGQVGHPTGRLDAQVPHARLGDAPEHRAVVAAELDDEGVGPRQLRGQQALGQCLEVLAHDRGAGGEIGVGLVEHALPGDLLKQLHHRAGLADPYREPEGELLPGVAGGDKRVGDGLAPEVRELGEPTRTDPA